MILRSWKRNMMSSSISAISLIIGLVCTITLTLFILGEYKIKDALGNTENVYLIERYDSFYNDKSSMTDNSNPKIVLKISEIFGEVEMLSIIKDANWRHDDKDAINKIRWGKGVFEVTPDFIKMFKIPVKEGNLERTLSTPSEIAVTNEYMQYIYGKDAVIGDRITAQTGSNSFINGVAQTKFHDVTITTILDEKTKTPFSYGALSLMTLSEINAMPNSYFNNFYAFIKLKEQANIDLLKSKINSDTTNFSKEHDFFFTPFHKVYLDDSQRNNFHGDTGFIIRRDPSLLIIGGTIAVAILIIAMFNYINITMTRAKNRLRNIAGQRIFGASKWNVRRQTILDTSLLVIISTIVSFIIIHCITSSFNNFIDCRISLTDLLHPQNAIVITSVLLLLIIVSSAYILVKIEIANPIEILKNDVSNKIEISSIMVVTQFVISIVLIAVSLNITRQINFIATWRPTANSILEVRNNLSEALPKEFIDDIKSLSIVDNFTSSRPTPNMSMSADGISVNQINANIATFDFYAMEMLEGRVFEQNDNDRNVIVNEAAIPIFKLEQPVIGSTMIFNNDTMNVIGVVKDFLYDDAHKSIQPLLIKQDKGDQSDTKYWNIYLKINGNVDEATNKLTAIWNKHYPNSAGIKIRSVAQIYKEMHPSEMRLMKIVNIFMIISISLTALGLFGLSFYTVERRAKEIAIRKIHGSTTMGVVLLLCRTFAIWVVISASIAVPIAIYFSKEWLSTFAYRVQILPWVFIVTIVIAAIITFITVIFQTWKAASANPASVIHN